MQAITTHNQPEYTVSELSGAIKRTMETSFGYVRVRGEISQGKLHSSGHYYFSLKDETSVLSSVCWKGKYFSLKTKPQDGLEVIAVGKISTFGGQSKYQLIVDSIEPAGAGALMALLEKRKAEYAAKGLFDAARKKSLPYMPAKIGVVTSPTGAVIRDILHRITERFPTNVVVWGVRVQGQGADVEIAAAIDGFNKMAQPPELIIVARGGGSLEDLWCFNEDAVVMAVANSVIPIISAVGHETDTTLIDYVSDLRAPTPTAAAELAVPVISDLRLVISDFKNRLYKSATRTMTERSNFLNSLVRGLPKLADVLGNYEQRLDGWSERLKNSLPVLINNAAAGLAKLKLHPMLLAKDIAKHEKDLKSWFERLQLNTRNLLEKKQEKTAATVKLFESYNYKNVLARGFAIIKTADGKLVKSAVTVPDAMNIEFADGVVGVAKR